MTLRKLVQRNSFVTSVGHCNDVNSDCVDTCSSILSERGYKTQNIRLDNLKLCNFNLKVYIDFLNKKFMAQVVHI